MPNHVTNKLHICAEEEQLEKILSAIQNDEAGADSIDFNKIIPTPDGIFQGPLGAEERARYGRNNWYDWNTSHWGTKWNAYDFAPHDGSGDIVFLTAWSAPQPVMQKLSELYPEIRIEHSWADEDIGCNVSKAVYLGGKTVELTIPDNGSRAAYDMAFEMLGYEPSEYGFLIDEKTGEYKYVGYDEPREMDMTQK